MGRDKIFTLSAWTILGNPSENLIAGWFDSKYNLPHFCVSYAQLCI